MAGVTNIVANVRELSHEAAEDLCGEILGQPSVRTVVLDLTRAVDATTAAFARLVVLRKKLLQNGRDLRVSGLRDRAENVFNVNRLQTILPLN
jgi:anti-anti-sigma regulatory factor